jgi:sugar phosphate isomerase/epimerase
MKPTLCADTLVGLTPVEAIRAAADLGYQGVEMVPSALAPDLMAFPAAEQRALAGVARDCGIEIVGFHWLLAGPAGLHATTPNASVRRRTLDYFRRIIELAANTGGRTLTFGSPQQRNYAVGDTADAATERLIAFFRDLAPELVGGRVTVSLEPLEPEYTNLVNSTAEACRVVDAVDAPCMGITLDTHFLRWECKTSGASMRDAFRLTGRRLAHLHIQDDNLLGPGMGKADFGEFLAAAREAGWQGAISLEPLGVTAPRLGAQVAAAGAAFFKTLRERGLTAQG